MGSMQVVAGDGERVFVDVRGHLLELDQPVGDGGSDSGPTPTELFVAGLAACVAHYGRGFLRRHGLPEEVHVDVEWHFAKSPTRVGSVTLEVWAPGLPQALRQRFGSVISHCTVHNSLTHVPEVTLRLTSPGIDVGAAG